MGLPQQTLLTRVCVSILLAVTYLSAPVCGEYISTDYDTYNLGGLGHRPSHHYRSSKEYTPVLQVNIWNETAVAQPGLGSHIFLRHDGPNSAAQSAPLILDARDLTAVYVNRSFANVFGPRVQEDRGKKYLTFWAGNKGDPEGLGDGFGLAYDEEYRLVYNVSAQGLGTHADLHEFEFTGQGTVLVNAVDPVVSHSAEWVGWAGGEEYPVLDAVVQEIDLDTNEVLFSWRALDHINPMDTVSPLITIDWDAFHLNSIEKVFVPLSNHHISNFILTFRDRPKKATISSASATPTQSVSPSLFVPRTSNVPQHRTPPPAKLTYRPDLISGTTGEILWVLGGKSNTFTELPPTINASAPLLTMRYQHHARFVPGTSETELTLFDNHIKRTSHGLCTRGTCSRGLHVRIDSEAQTVQILHEYLHPSQLQAQSQGSLQALMGENSKMENVFIGWGRCPSFTQHDAETGETLLDVQISPWHSELIVDALDNYRAYRMNWTATPLWDPAVQLVETREGDLEVYVSWNGATEVREWAVRGMVSKSVPLRENGGEKEQLLARSRRTGFETKLTVGRFGLRALWVEALDGEGAVLRASEKLDFVNGNVTILPWEEEKVVDVKESAGGGWVSTLLGVSGALVGAAVVWVGGKALWKRYQTYYQLLEEEDSDFDESDSDVDIEMDAAYASGLDMDVPEPWQDFAPRQGTLLGDFQRNRTGSIGR